MSRQDTPTHSTGAHRRHRAPAGRAAERDRDRRPRGTLPLQPPGHYEPYLDGLFTYCLSILCEHDAATAALGETLALAERQRARLRDTALRKPWLYALARWACLRRLAAGAPPLPRACDDVAEQRRAQLASLAWPEAAGTTPEQREALELAVRHQLTPAETGHVLGLDAETARSRLARAACEVERTRTALAVVDSGRCELVAQLAGETRVLLGSALRAELVRHVDECAVCRRTAERVVAAEPWPGTTEGRPGGSSAVLVLLQAPRAAVYTAQLHAMDAGVGRSREATPRFDRRGFPLDLRDRAARRAQLRHRAVTTTVVAAVVAAPVLALWAAYHAALTGEDAPGHGGRATAGEHDGLDGVPYQKAGSTVPSPRAGASSPPAAPSSTAPDSASPTVTVQSGPAGSAAPGGSRLTVTARAGSGATTLVTLSADGDAPVTWSATTSAYWLTLSSRGGELDPGQSVTLSVTVDPSLEPAGAWTAEIDFAPGGAVVTLHGRSSRGVPPPVSPSPSPTTTSATPTPTPTTPTSTPTTGSPSPSPTNDPTATSGPPPSAPASQPS